MRKNGRWYRPGGASIVLFILGMGISCDIQNPLDDLIVLVEFSPVSLVVGGQIFNAATNSPIEDRMVEVVITGADQNAVVDLTGRAQTEFAIENGFLTFGISEGTTPSQNSPLQIKAVTHAKGYLSNSAALTIQDTTAVQFEVNMVEIANPPAGVVVVQNTKGQTDATGAVVSTFEVSTGPEPMTQAMASVTIPQNTIIKDASGAPLSGQLTTTLAYHNNQSEESLAAFPGGFSVTLSQNEDGVEEDVVFVTGGFASIEIADASGRMARTFDSPITVSAQIPGATINPKTGTRIKNGDVIKVWSYATGTGAWKYENKVTAGEPDGNGNFNLTFEVNHLSVFNFGWSYDSFQGEACGISRAIQLRGYDGRPGVKLKIKTIGGGFERRINLTDRDVSLVLQNVPNNTPVRIEAIYEGTVISSLEVDDLCSGGDLFIDLALPSNNIDVSAEVKGFCANRPDVEIRPTMPIYYRKSGSTEWIYAGTMIDGRIVIRGLEVNQTYQFRATYEGVTETVEFLIEEDMSEISFDVEIPAYLCG